MNRLRLCGLLLAALALVGVSWGQVLSTGTGHPISINGAPFPIITSSGGGPTLPAYDPYPRIMALAITGSQITSYVSANWTTYAPMYNALVYANYVGSEGSIGGSSTYASVFLATKTASTLATPPRQGFYIQACCQWTGTGTDNTDGWVVWTGQVNTNNWWVRASWPSGAIPIYSGTTELGYLLLGPNNAQTDTNGRTVFQEFAYHFDQYDTQANADGESPGQVANPTLNLYFFDNQWAKTVVAGTWGATTVTTDYAAGNSTATTYEQKGEAALVTAWRAQHPGVLIVGNNNYWAVGTKAGGSTTLDPSNVGLFDYAFAQGVETDMEYTATTLMQMLEQQESLVNSTGTVVVGNAFSSGAQQSCGVVWPAAQSSWVSADFQTARAWDAMTNMRNWTWSPGSASQAGNTLYWFDEQEQGGVHGWLSNGTQRLDPPQTGPATQVTLTGTGNVSSVWVRRFPNGWVLWNPYNNGSVNITGGIPTTLHRLTNISSSTGDSTINTGAAVSFPVTLGDTISGQSCGDGLFLIGTG